MHTCDPGSLAAPNYTFVAGAPAELRITKAQLTATAADQTITAGGQVANLTATITGFVQGQSLESSDVTGTAACTTTATAQSPAGSYPITCAPGTLNSADYDSAFARVSPAASSPQAATGLSSRRSRAARARSPLTCQ